MLAFFKNILSKQFFESFIILDPLIVITSNVFLVVLGKYPRSLNFLFKKQEFL